MQQAARNDSTIDDALTRVRQQPETYRLAQEEFRKRRRAQAAAEAKAKAEAKARKAAKEVNSLTDEQLDARFKELEQEVEGRLRASVQQIEEYASTVAERDGQIEAHATREQELTARVESLTQERDRTEDMVGVTYGPEVAPAPKVFRWGEKEIALLPETPQRPVKIAEGARVLAKFAEDLGPAVTEKAIGKGKVIGMHLSVGAELEKNDNPALAACFAALVQEASRPEIVAGGTGFRMISTLRKGNWIAVSLLADEVPSVARLHIDLKALGIEKDGFRMMMLGKEMEITRPGDLWGETGFWSAEELKNGFRVTIAADHRRNMPLPDTFDLSAFKGKKGKQQADYINNITRAWWDSESRGKRKRTYSHEIVVLAPGDEPAMPRE